MELLAAQPRGCLVSVSCSASVWVHRLLINPVYPSIFCPALWQLAAKITTVLISETKKKNLVLWLVYLVHAKARCRQAGFCSENLIGPTRSWCCTWSTYEVISRTAFFSSFSMSIYSCLSDTKMSRTCSCREMQVLLDVDNCLQREILVRFSCCWGPIPAASETEFLNGWLNTNLLGSFAVFHRN